MEPSVILLWFGDMLISHICPISYLNFSLAPVHKNFNILDLGHIWVTPWCHCCSCWSGRSPAGCSNWDNDMNTNLHCTGLPLLHHPNKVPALRKPVTEPGLPRGFCEFKCNLWQPLSLERSGKSRLITDHPSDLVHRALHNLRRADVQTSRAFRIVPDITQPLDFTPGFSLALHWYLPHLSDNIAKVGNLLPLLYTIDPIF